MAEKTPFMQRHYFLFRRLHSLTGIIPVGLFLVVHLITNSSIVWGAINTRGGETGAERGAFTFQHEVNFIHSLPFLIFIEVAGLWLPLAFHSVLGVYYAVSGKHNTTRYGYQANWRYSLQRFSGYVGILFIFYHLATLRWGWNLPFSAVFEPERAASTMALAMRGGVEEVGAGAVVVALFYFIGVSLLVFHFANGLWTAAITWGITISRGAQERWGYACTGIGAVLMIMGWMSIVGFATADIAELRAFEDRMRHEPVTPLETPAELR